MCLALFFASHSDYGSSSGPRIGQRVHRGSTPLLDLSYRYTLTLPPRTNGPAIGSVALEQETL